MHQVQSKKREITDLLATRYPRVEAEQMARWLLEKAGGAPYPTLLLKGGNTLRQQLGEWVERIRLGEPIQYVLGEVQFAGLTLKVAPGVLIPRPETEELCYLVRERQLLSGAKRIADLCTGSGCIALAMATMAPTALVEGVDVSDEALTIATQNSLRLGLNERVQFVKQDLLAPNFAPSATYDLVISNPPYVLESERSTIAPHVLQHEPETALFVPDDDALLFYYHIIHRYTPHLRQGGAFAFELNPITAEVVQSIGEQYKLRGEVIKDMYGRERFYIGIK